MIIQFFRVTATLRMPKTAPEIYEKALFKFSPFWRRFTWIGCTVFFFGIFVFGILADYKTCLIFFGIWAISVGFWFVRKVQLKKNRESRW